MALIIAGRIVPMSVNDPSAVVEGRIYLGDDGFVEAVTAGDAGAPAGFESAPVVETGDALRHSGIDRSAQSSRLQRTSVVGGANAEEALSSP